MRIAHLLEKEQFDAVDLMAQITGLDSADIVFVKIVFKGFIPFTIRSIRKIAKGFEVDAITIGKNKIMINKPLCLKTKSDLALICHELTHIMQIRKLGLVRFFIKYMKEYRHNLKKYPSQKAYNEISFEEEAVRNQLAFLEEYKK